MIGSQAPPLTVGAWIKGDPGSATASGQVRVVEFWASWCGPCEASLPHLTRLAHRFKGRVEIVGVDSSEANSDPYVTIPLVDGYVAGKGLAMDYNVAIDTPGRSTWDAWMKASGRSGIPCAFVVGKDNRIQWIGHPDDLDEVITAVVAGTYMLGDDLAEAKAHEEAKACAASKRYWLPKILRLLRSGKDPDAQREIRTAFATDPRAFGILCCCVLDPSVTRNLRVVEKFARYVGDIAFQRDDGIPVFIAFGILGDQALRRKVPPSLLIHLAQLSLLKSPNEPSCLMALAEAYELAGRFKDAANIQELGLKKVVGTPYEKMPWWTKPMHRDLARYRKEAASGS